MKLLRRLGLGIVGVVFFTLLILMHKVMFPAVDENIVFRYEVENDLPRKDERSVSREETTLLTALNNHASSDKCIIMAFVDEPVIDMALNLYETSFLPHKIDNFLYIATEPYTCTHLLVRNIQCYHYRLADMEAAMEAIEASVFRSKDFIRKNSIRNAAVMDALTAGFTILLTDIDLVYFKDPLPELKAILQNNEVAAMWDGQWYNSGFLILKSTEITRKLWQITCDKTSVADRISGQPAFNWAVKLILSRNNTGEQPLRIAKLDENRYANGFIYFNKMERWLPRDAHPCDTDRTCNSATVVHNNFIVTYEAKVYRFKEHLLWTQDKADYYSSASRHYLIYDNPIRVKWSMVNNGSFDQINALKTALAVGQLLDRIVILPRFHCLDKHMFFYDCPLNSIIAIKTLDSHFNGLYRESTFLRNPKVPESVRNSITSKQSVHTLAVVEKPLPSRATKAKRIIRINADQILKQFGSIPDRVLQLESLYDINVRFSTREEQDAFDEAAVSAMKTTNYIQDLMRVKSWSKKEIMGIKFIPDT